MLHMAFEILTDIDSIMKQRIYVVWRFQWLFV